MAPATDSTATNILTEDVLSLSEARRELFQVTGRRPDKATIYRWCKQGVGGVRLEHVRLGNIILTSTQAITRFIAARTAR